ncbi:A-kinase anchor protein 14 isoform X3 [Elephas maximus indicus]|uniref:A-kinase anchor protein 14 isoform X3 n=1 Tax=Elephas maximus indicus TaxID=99487 RepID=UPI0021171EA7|nr:A-kinase anchor protein 14 isoform X3 [Elephas maximus indicus]
MEVDKPVKTKKRVRLLSKPEVIIERDDIIRMTEMAQSVSEEVILAAVQTVEDIEHPVKNIRWITHGEFTVEGGRLHIEKFISPAACHIACRSWDSSASTACEQASCHLTCEYWVRQPLQLPESGEASSLVPDPWTWDLPASTTARGSLRTSGCTTQSL